MGVQCKPAPGTFGGTCFGVPCETGLQCCLDKWKCYTPDVCDEVCTRNADCIQSGHDFICCSNGYFDSCLPVLYCR